MPDDFTKATFNLPTSLLDELRKLAEERGESVTTILRTAIGNELYLTKQAKEDARILIERPDGAVRELVFPEKRSIGSRK